jgi:poly-gamma-glutamate synthesis protein (capsule biosynthesis protein)
MSTPLGSTLIWIEPNLPGAFREGLTLPPGFSQAGTPELAQMQVRVGETNQVSQWIYALVAPFPTIPSSVSSQILRRSWQGDNDGPFAGQPILLDESTLGVFSAWWGPPAPGATRVLPGGEILQHAWDHRPSWAIVPFEALEPRWKVLEVDNQSPLHKEFVSQNYPLTVPISLEGDPEATVRLAGGNGSTSAWMVPLSNRQPDHLTTVILTGVTALVRATAFTMHRNGITYPAQDIGEILREADITHISNEIPFTPDCPPPDPTQSGLRFCSNPDYIGLLEEVGTDIVELTGDHFGDWGPEAMLYTLDMYDQRNWEYYGGGYNREDARQARLIEHNGNRLAIIGCNAKGGGYATASENQPGAVACDYDWMHKEIKRLSKEGYQVIATFQHFEYYTYTAQPNQVRDFQGMADAGAIIVSGSQAHQPQGMEFHKKAFIHYGLGNLFFDQYHFCTNNACDDGFINRHVFYGGRYISTELIPIVFMDYARPRPMTPEESAILLQTIFSASGW